MSRRFVLALLAAMTLSACNKSHPAESTLRPSERVAPSPVGTSQNILQKTFSLKKVASFPFEIPAHAARPHLRGTYESFAHGGAVDDTANVDFLILNEEQFADLQGNRPGEALMSAESSHNQDVDYYLPASLGQPAKYYLVFRNSSGTGSEVVKADFHIEF